MSIRFALIGAAFVLAAQPALAQKKYGPGVSDTEIKVGQTIGEGLVGCLKADGKTSANVVELNGSPDDNNATLFKQGYDKVIRDAGYKVVADQAVPKWNNDTGGQLFEQIYTKQKGKFVAVAAANDGLGGAVIAVLKRNGLAGKVPVSGQDVVLVRFT